MALDEPKEKDVVEAVEDINILIGDDMQGAFKEINIDYGSGFLKKGFQITSDHGGGSC